VANVTALIESKKLWQMTKNNTMILNAIKKKHPSGWMLRCCKY